MKKIFVLICLLTSLSASKAQTLYTTTTSGGDYGGGTLNKFIGTEKSITVLKSFEYTLEQSTDFDRFVFALDGKFYGLAHSGGHRDLGFICSFDPVSKIFIKLQDFDGINGSNPAGRLVQARDGKLYGVTRGGGADNNGVIFSFDPSNAVYSKLKDFPGADGRYGAGSLIEASDGKLYGVTSRGGKDDFGVLFSFDPRSGVYSNLAEFDGTNGKFPVGGLVQASDGQLYGTTFGEGRTREGMVIFSYNILTVQLAVVKEFENDLFGRPVGDMVEAGDRKLYGVLINQEPLTESGLFSFDPATAAFTILESFYWREELQDGLTLASNGKIYGMTSRIHIEDGEYNQGSIFSYDPSSLKYEVEFDFYDVNTTYPYGALAEGSGGKLYGITNFGGPGFKGVIFSFDISTGTFSQEWDKVTNESGSSPTGALVLGPDKKLYGMTTLGGSKGNGTIFSYDLRTSTFTKLKDFNGADGANPRGSLLLAGDNLLYGMTTNGGRGGGVIFSFNLKTSTYEKLKDFTAPDGANPFGSLIQAKDGRLYGMTSAGGTLWGVIFSYDPKDSIFRKLHSFDTRLSNSEGNTPYGDLVEASNGRLYGLTSRGGFDSGEGALFSFDPKLSTYRLIYSFYNNGREPLGSLIQASDGKLYGMTRRTDKAGLGVIFSILPSQANSYQKLHSFGVAGYYPYGDLMQASNGKLYGLTSEGGSSGLGAIFSYDLASGRYTKLKDFDGKNGSFPLYGSGFLEISGGPGNTPPVLGSIGNKLVNELQKLKIVVTAADSDQPADTLSFTLDKPANGKFPEGATINKTSGVFSWTPTEAQGPGTYRVKIVVHDGINTDEEEIEIGVQETVTHPVLNIIGARSVSEGATLSFTASATDADLPPASLRYSLIKLAGKNFPEGASINPDSGIFTWTPDEQQGPGEYCVKIVVSDGECTDEEEIRITVNEVNSPPSFTKGADITLFDDARRQPIIFWATKISAGAADEKDQALHFLVANNNHQLFSEQPALSADGTLTFATASGMCGIAIVSVILKDNGGTDFGGSDQSPAQTFLITVNADKINLFAYPNHFGKNATLGFTLPAAENLVILDLNDLRGARLQRIFEGSAEANQTQRFIFNGSSYSPGIYFLRLVTSNNIKTFKIIMSE